MTELANHVAAVEDDALYCRHSTGHGSPHSTPWRHIMTPAATGFTAARASALPATRHLLRASFISGARVLPCDSVDIPYSSIFTTPGRVTISTLRTCSHAPLPSGSNKLTRIYHSVQCLQGLRALQDLANEEATAHAKYLSMLGMILDEVTRRPLAKLQEKVGDVKEYIKAMLVHKPEKGGYKELATGGSAFVLTRGKSMYKVLRLYNEDLQNKVRTGCTAVRLAAEHQAGLPPMSDHVGRFYQVQVIKTRDLHDVIGNPGLVNTILTKRMTGCRNGYPDAMMFVRMEPVHGKTLRQVLHEFRASSRLNPSLQYRSREELMDMASSGRPIMMSEVDGAELCSFFATLIAATKDMHHHRVMHGDLKPENVMWLLHMMLNKILAKVIDSDGAEPVDKNGFPLNGLAYTPMYCCNTWRGEEGPRSLQADVRSIGFMILESLLGEDGFARLYHAEAGKYKVVRPIQQLMLAFEDMGDALALWRIMSSAKMTPLKFRQMCAKETIAIDLHPEQCSQELLLGSKERPTTFRIFANFIYSLKRQPIAQFLLVLAIRCMFGKQNIAEIAEVFVPLLDKHSDKCLPEHERILTLPAHLDKRDESTGSFIPVVPEMPPTDSMEGHLDSAAAQSAINTQSSESGTITESLIPAYHGDLPQASFANLSASKHTDALQCTLPGCIPSAQDRHCIINRHPTDPGNLVHDLSQPCVPPRMAISTALTLSRRRMAASSATAVAASMPSVCSQKSTELSYLAQLSTANNKSSGASVWAMRSSFRKSTAKVHPITDAVTLFNPSTVNIDINSADVSNANNTSTACNYLAQLPTANSNTSGASVWAKMRSSFRKSSAKVHPIVDASTNMYPSTSSVETASNSTSTASSTSRKAKKHLSRLFKKLSGCFTGVSQ